MDCIFCKINKNEIPSYTIYEDEIVKVMLDIHPDTNGHCLIIPKKHIINIEDMDEETLNHIMKIYKKMYTHLKERLHFDGLSIVQNNGTVQDIKHFHLHLVPKYHKNKNLSIEEVYNLLKKDN